MILLSSVTFRFEHNYIQHSANALNWISDFVHNIEIEKFHWFNFHSHSFSMFHVSICSRFFLVLRVFWFNQNNYFLRKGFGAWNLKVQQENLWPRLRLIITIINGKSRHVKEKPCWSHLSSLAHQKNRLEIIIDGLNNNNESLRFYYYFMQQWRLVLFSICAMKYIIFVLYPNLRHRLMHSNSNCI